MWATNFEHRYSFEIVIFWHVTACRSDAYLEAGDSSILQTLVPVTIRHTVSIQKTSFHSFCREILMPLFSSYIMFCDDIYAFLK